MHNEAAVILERLSGLEGVQMVTRGWPKRLGRLPAIALNKAADMPVDFRDDGGHITQLEYDVRIFADRAAQADALCQAVDAQMEALGYVRTMAYDDDSQQVRLAVLRYRRFV